MCKMERKLHDVWGMSSLVFCKACGVPTVLGHCSHEAAAPWTELNERERTRVRRRAIQKVQADRLAQDVFTVAS